MDLPSAKAVASANIPDVALPVAQSSSPQLSAIPPDAPPRSLSPAQLASQAEARQRTDALLRDLWKQKLPMVREQLRTIERALQSLQSTTLTAPLRTEAAMTAHKLAGSLGMFGYHDGTLLARQLETQLDSDQPLSQPDFARTLQQLAQSLDL